MIMKKFFAAIFSLTLCGVILAACGNDKTPDAGPAESQTSSETKTAETETETETAETETETETAETDTAETDTETVTEPSAIAETAESINIDEILKLIEENSKTVGNDTAGYITVYAGAKYEEYEDGNFTLTSEDGRTLIFTELYTDIQTDLEQTAYMFCLTVAMNAEIDGYETYNINDVTVDGMNGGFAVMIDTDADLGFKLYAAFADTENGMIRALGCECSEFTDESLIASSAVFDSYRRSLED